ncbi:hypothetical protein [Brevibacterium zhoupengii]|uniref:hypothetical protein n=1 Tax=Brevibacterium zhoupengii TaxID=2898795 RepID=UPI001E627D41|nr:hypothetical protein [Brevibacterium zhoupengii]
MAPWKPLQHGRCCDGLPRCRDSGSHLPDGPRKLLQKYVDVGDLGQKTGHGFFDYSKDSAESK